MASRTGPAAASTVAKLPVFDVKKAVGRMDVFFSQDKQVEILQESNVDGGQGDWYGNMAGSVLM